MTRSRLLPLASLAAAALLVTACGGDDDSTDTTEAVETTAASDTTESSETTVPETTEAPATTEDAVTTVPETTEAVATTEAPETTAAGTDSTAAAGAVPAGEPTAPGTALAYGDAAVVALDDELPDELVELVVQAPEQGTQAELEELQVPDVAAGSTLHYLTVDVTNISAPATGGDYFPSTSLQLLVLQDDGRPAQPIINFIDFAPCDEEDPDDLAVGESFTTCITYLAAPDATIAGVSFAQTFTSESIDWS